jgi:DNA polymerase V
MCATVRFSTTPTVRSSDTSGQREEARAGGALSLDELLVRHPAATFFMRAEGDGMAGAGIADGDLLVVDRSLDPTAGRLVVAVTDEGFTLRRLRRRDGRWLLLAEPAPGAAHPKPEYAKSVWGVVTASFKQHGPPVADEA